MRVLIFLLAALTTRMFFTKTRGVENHGVGHVERSIVGNTMTPLQVKSYRQQKTIMMPFVVDRKRNLQKILIVGEDAQAIVENVGLKLVLHVPLVALSLEYFYLEPQDD
jgi:hypothetical protein